MAEISRLFVVALTHRHNNGLSICSRDGDAQAAGGELLGLAVLTKAFALGDCQWPGGLPSVRSYIWGLGAMP